MFLKQKKHWIEIHIRFFLKPNQKCVLAGPTREVRFQFFNWANIHTSGLKRMFLCTSQQSLGVLKIETEAERGIKRKWYLAKNTITSAHNTTVFPFIPLLVCLTVVVFSLLCPGLVSILHIPHCPWHTGNAWLSAVLTLAECSHSIWPGDKCWKGPINMDATHPPLLFSPALPRLPDELACVCVCLCLGGTPFALSHHVPTVCLLTLTEIHSLAVGAHHLRLLTTCQRAR